MTACFPRRIHSLVVAAPISELALSTYAHAADGSQSAYWGGMAVHDAQMNSLPFSVASESGRDFSRSKLPVPLPGSWALLVAGLILLAVRRPAASPSPSMRPGRCGASYPTVNAALR